jgi:mobilization protein
MAKSSINFQKSKGHSYDHNFRKDEPNYLLKPADRLENFYWQNEKSAREIFDEELKSYGTKKGKRPTFENSHWEAVLNLNKNHTLEDVQKLAEYIEQKFNITCATIAVHRDEGHYKNDKPQHNFHAHITFVTVKDGQQNWRKEKIKPADLRELQTAVAEMLQMERGQENSEAERLSHKQYKKAAQQKEQLEREILSLKERNAILEQERKESKGKGFLKGFFDSLSSIKKSDQEFNKDELLAEIERLKALDKQRRDEIERLRLEQQELAEEVAKSSLYTKKLEQDLEEKNKTIKAQEIQIINLKQENSELKNFISKAMTYVRDHAKDVFSFIKNIFSNELTEPLLNEKEKDEEFIEQIEKTQQRSNLTPLQPENKERVFKARRQ